MTKQLSEKTELKIMDQITDILYHEIRAKYGTEIALEIGRSKETTYKILEKMHKKKFLKKIKKGLTGGELTTRTRWQLSDWLRKRYDGEMKDG